MTYASTASRFLTLSGLFWPNLHFVTKLKTKGYTLCTKDICLHWSEMGIGLSRFCSSVELPLKALYARETCVTKPVCAFEKAKSDFVLTTMLYSDSSREVVLFWVSHFHHFFQNCSFGDYGPKSMCKAAPTPDQTGNVELEYTDSFVRLSEDSADHRFFRTICVFEVQDTVAALNWLLAKAYSCKQIWRIRLDRSLRHLCLTKCSYVRWTVFVRTEGSIYMYQLETCVALVWHLLIDLSSSVHRSR